MFCSHTIMSDAPLCAGDGETMILQRPASASCPTQRVCLWLCFIHSLTVKQNYNSPENQDPTPQFTVKRWVSGLNLRTLLRVCVYMSLLACLHNPVWINMRWFMNKHGCEHTHTHLLTQIYTYLTNSGLLLSPQWVWTFSLVVTEGSSTITLVGWAQCPQSVSHNMDATLVLIDSSSVDKGFFFFFC